MKGLKRALFSRDADTTCLTVEEGAWIQGSLAGSKQLRDTRPDPCPVRAVCESIRAADGTEVTESAGITSVFP
jgi:hypothetical protein